MNFKKFFYFFLSLIVLLSYARASLADNRPGAFVISPGVGAYLFDTDRGAKNNAMYNLGLGYDFNRNWGIEALAGVVPTTSKINNESLRGSFYSIDGIYHFSTNIPLEPYLLAGAGLLDSTSSQSQLDTQPNLNAGAGLEYFIGNSVALHSDIRDIYTVSNGKSDFLVNFGVRFLVGGVNHCVSPIHYCQTNLCSGTKWTLRFANKSADIDPIYSIQLEKAVNCLVNNPKLKVNLDGYANCLNNFQQNSMLSQQRANNVKEYLVTQGINPTRINAQGFGEASASDTVVISLFGLQG